MKDWRARVIVTLLLWVCVRLSTRLVHALQYCLSHFGVEIYEERERSIGLGWWGLFEVLPVYGEAHGVLPEHTFDSATSPLSATLFYKLSASRRPTGIHEHNFVTWPLFWLLKLTFLQFPVSSSTPCSQLYGYYSMRAESRSLLGRTANCVWTRGKLSPKCGIHAISITPKLMSWRPKARTGGICTNLIHQWFVVGCSPTQSTSNSS